MPAAKPIKMPKKVKVLTRVYEVKMDKKAWAEITWNQDKVIAKGWTDHQNCVIILWPEMDPNIVAEILWHEVKHCITSVTGIAEDLDDNKVTEEQLVTRMAPVELAILRDNPKLMEFLAAHVD